MIRTPRNEKTLHKTIRLQLGLLTAALLLTAGCAVNDVPGEGIQLKLKEYESNKGYYLYLPAGYDPKESYAVVLTIHCIKPFDSAHRQIREWESTADKYGFIVVAPVVATANPLPLWFNHVSSTMKRDEKGVMKVLDEVLSDTSGDPSRVFITAMSCGGTLMHYLANQYPARFAGMCARGCWFNSKILSEENARQMADSGFPVLIHYAEYDGANIKADSWKAVRRYRQMGFEVEFMVIGQTLRLPAFGHMQGAAVHKAGEFFSRCLKKNAEIIHHEGHNAKEDN